MRGDSARHAATVGALTEGAFTSPASKRGFAPGSEIGRRFLKYPRAAAFGPVKTAVAEIHFVQAQLENLVLRITSCSMRLARGNLPDFPPP